MYVPPPSNIFTVVLKPKKRPFLRRNLCPPLSLCLTLCLWSPSLVFGNLGRPAERGRRRQEIIRPPRVIPSSLMCAAPPTATLHDGRARRRDGPTGDSRKAHPPISPIRACGNLGHCTWDVCVCVCVCVCVRARATQMKSRSYSYIPSTKNDSPTHTCFVAAFPSPSPSLHRTPAAPFHLAK